MAIQISGGGGAAGGSGNETDTDTYANIPAAGTDGNLFLPSDGEAIYRDTGAAWAPWGPIYPFTEPVNGDFSWDNQGGASVDATYGGIYLTAPAGGAASNVRARYKAAPSTPYTITAWITPHLLAYNYLDCGILFRQNSDGKLIIFKIAVSGDWNLTIDKYTDTTTWSATYATLVTKEVGPGPVCLRIADNATNRICSWSIDGRHFHTLHTVGRTDFLTADQVGFSVQAYHVTYPASMMLHSWAEG